MDANERNLLQDLPREVFRLVLQHLLIDDLKVLDQAVINYPDLKYHYWTTLNGLTIEEEIVVRSHDLTEYSNSSHASSIPLCDNIHWILQKNILPMNIQLKSFPSTIIEPLILRSRRILKTLTLNPNKESYSFDNFELLFQHLGKCPTLQSLKLNRCSNISEVTLLQFLSLNSQLQHLEIRDMNHLFSVAELLIAKCPHLKSLIIPHNQWFSESFTTQLIATHPPLKILDLRLTNTTDDDIQQILYSFPHLQQVVFEWYKLSNETLVLCWKRLVIEQLTAASASSSEGENERESEGCHENYHQHHQQQLQGLKNASHILFYRREEIFERENLHHQIIPRLITFLQSPSQSIREEASRVLTNLPQTLIRANLVKPLLEMALHGDLNLQVLCCDVILSICDLDISLMPLDSNIFSLFNTFFTTRVKHSTIQFSRCVSYFVKNVLDIRQIMNSQLLEYFLTLDDAPDILTCVVDLICYSASNNYTEFLNYLVDIGVFNYLLDMLYVEPKDECFDDNIFDCHAVHGLRQLLKVDERCRKLLHFTNLPKHAIKILI